METGSVKVELLGSCHDNHTSDTPQLPPHPCEYPECKKSFHKPSILQYHIDTVHKKMKLYMCIYPDCDKSFYFITKMHRHLETHTEKKFKCSWCSTMFNRKDNLKYHQRTCQIVLICAVCGMTFLSSADLNEHSVSHGQTLKCVFEGCEERMSASCLTEHISTCHSQALKCPCCNKVYSAQDELNTHIKIAHDKVELVLEEPLDIELWLRTQFFAAEDEEELISDQGTAATSTETTSTVATSTEEPTSTETVTTKLFHCTYEDCTYSTPTPRWLTKHSLKHKRQNKCHHCTKQFADKWSLTLHTRTHDEDTKSFLCSKCDKTFLSQSRLSQHIQTHHKESLEWACDQNECGEVFSTHRRLLQHHKYHSLGTDTEQIANYKTIKRRRTRQNVSDSKVTVCANNNSTGKSSRRKRKDKNFSITMNTPETYKPYISCPFNDLADETPL